MSDEKTPSNDIALPDGWTSSKCGTDSTVIGMPDGSPGGYVTIDWNRRTFAGGYGRSCGMAASTKTYAGRGWRQAIVKDAVAWLAGIYETKRHRP